MNITRICDLSNEQLISLRKQIVLGSLYYSDYDNDLGINLAEACDFFDGYIEYLWEIAAELKLNSIDDLESDDNLIDWANCCDFDESERSWYKENYPQYENTTM